MAFARTRMPSSTWVPAGAMIWPSPTTHEPFFCGPVWYVGYGLDWPAASPGRHSPAASTPASGLRRSIRDLFRDLFRGLFRGALRDINRSPVWIFFIGNQCPPCHIGMEL